MISNIATGDITAAKRFHQDVLGLERPSHSNRETG
jgi:hypothetical protein